MKPTLPSKIILIFDGLAFDNDEVVERSVEVLSHPLYSSEFLLCGSLSVLAAVVVIAGKTSFNDFTEERSVEYVMMAENKYAAFLFCFQSYWMVRTIR